MGTLLSSITMFECIYDFFNLKCKCYTAEMGQSSSPSVYTWHNENFQLNANWTAGENNDIKIKLAVTVTSLYTPSCRNDDAAPPVEGCCNGAKRTTY